MCTGVGAERRTQGTWRVESKLPEAQDIPFLETDSTSPPSSSGRFVLMPETDDPIQHLFIHWVIRGQQTPWGRAREAWSEEIGFASMQGSLLHKWNPPCHGRVCAYLVGGSRWQAGQRWCPLPTSQPALLSPSLKHHSDQAALRLSKPRWLFAVFGTELKSELLYFDLTYLLNLPAQLTSLNPVQCNQTSRTNSKPHKSRIPNF